MTSAAAVAPSSLFCSPSPSLPLLLLAALLLQGALFAPVTSIRTYHEHYTTEDMYIPDECPKIAGAGDHLLVEYTVSSSDGRTLYSVLAPEQQQYLFLDFAGEHPIHTELKGMCQNATKSMTWRDGGSVVLEPLLLLDQDSDIKRDTGTITLTFTLAHVTAPEDFEIFSALAAQDRERLLDLLQDHRGINAINEYGDTPLNLAFQYGMNNVAAELINARMPWVNVNYAKPSGRTALFYSLESEPMFLMALLRRGADPNAFLRTKDSYGSTALHFACLLEKQRQAEILLEFGADPLKKNTHGKTPFDLVPAGAPGATRRFFKNLFQEAIKKIDNKNQEDYHVKNDEL